MIRGYKTSEFYISAFVAIVGVLLASGVIPADTVWDKIAGAILAGLAALGYTGSRTRIKAAASSDPTSGPPVDSTASLR